MAASTTDPDKLYRKWGAWIEAVRAQLVLAHHYQAIWSEVKDAIVERYPASDPTFLYAFSKLYVDHQLSLVRRVSEDTEDKREEKGRGTASLGSLIRQIKENPEVLTRTRFVRSRVSRGGTVSAHDLEGEWQRLFATKSDPEHISRARLKSDYARVTTQISPIVRRVNKSVAHLDDRISRSIARGGAPRIGSVTWGDLSAALSDLCDVANRYLILLKGDEFVEWTPAIQGDWQEPLRASLFPSDRPA